MARRKPTKGSVKKAAAALDELNDKLSKLSTKMVNIAGSYSKAKEAGHVNDVKTHIAALKKMTAEKKKLEAQKNKLDAALEKAVSGLDADAQLDMDENIDLAETVKVSLAKLLSESSKNTDCCK